MMERLLHRLPIPSGCVALGLIGLGTLLSSVNSLFLYSCGALSIFLQALVILKLLITGERRAVFADNGALTTLAGTSMAMMLTAAQLNSIYPFSPWFFLWILGLVFHLNIFLCFTTKIFRERPSISAVRGSWLLVYVGIAAASVSSQAFSAQHLGELLLIPAALGVIILLPLVYLADRRFDNIPCGQRPLFCISAAPVSLWLVGYLSVSDMPSRTFVSALLLFSQILYFPALIRCLQNLRKEFSPAFAAFSFPFVICVSAMKQGGTQLGILPLLRVPILIETVLAAFLCLYVLWSYVRFLFRWNHG